MKTSQLFGKKGYKIFSEIGHKVYEGNPFYRGTEASIEKLVILGPTVFHNHARVKFFIVEDGNDTIARFALIHDRKLPDYVQVAFFEARHGLNGIWHSIRKEIRRHFPAVPKAIVGLNGHLNYSAGLLMSHFDQPPVFGLPYSQPYYSDYFKELHIKPMVSYRFTLAEYVDWLKNFRLDRHNKDVTLRIMDKSKIRDEITRYTILNNVAFHDHLYWTDREIEEDMELLYPFRLLLKNENLIFAEYKGEPIGFFLWYPDYNELVSGVRDLSVWDLIRYRLRGGIQTFRFAEIGIIPKFRKSYINLWLLQHSLPYIEAAGLKYCECGFIFEENRASMAMMNRFMGRFYQGGKKPYRHYALFEEDLRK